MHSLISLKDRPSSPRLVLFPRLPAVCLSSSVSGIFACYSSSITASYHFQHSVLSACAPCVRNREQVGVLSVSLLVLQAACLWHLSCSLFFLPLLLPSHLPPPVTGLCWSESARFTLVCCDRQSNVGAVCVQQRLKLPRYASPGSCILHSECATAFV